LRISNDDGRAFIQRAPLEIWKRPFAPLPPPAAVQRKLEKERRRAREAAKANGEAVPTETDASARASSEKPSPRHISHFVMNLPGSALEFLDAYAGSYAPLLQEPDFPGKEQIEMPLVHVHCFTKEIEPEKGQQDILEVSGA
jgi:tRNA (guanine37-N1)-methyltransferase